METGCPSLTALRVAMRRAAHQILDDPKIFDDPLALRVLGFVDPAPPGQDRKWLEETPLSRVLRASLAARSRYAEDELCGAIERGVGQYVLLGAGLDTFAYRNPFPEGVLRVFEVDHPATQDWKRARLEQAGIQIPDTLTFSPVDFESQTLEEGLRQAGFDSSRPAFFSWLGVTMYLTNTAVVETLRSIASMPAGSGVIFDYLILPSLMNPAEHRVFDGLAHRVALAGEPFQTFFDPATLEPMLRDMGFNRLQDVRPEEMDARYFGGRTDGLRMGRLAHLMNAQI